MTKTKNKSVKKVVVVAKKTALTPKEREKKKLELEADKAIKAIKDTNLMRYHIATVMGVYESSLSRFMTKKPGYVTKTMLEKVNKFLDSLKPVAPVDK